MLQQTLYNINKEIDRTAAATIRIIEDARLHGDTLTVVEIKLLLRKELGREQEEPQTQTVPEPEPEQPKFSDLLSFFDYYIDLCEKGAVLNSRGMRLSPGTIRNTKSARSALTRYCKARHRKLSMESFGISDYYDIVGFLNESRHLRGQGYLISVIAKMQKDLRHVLRYAFEHDYSNNEIFRNKEFRVYQTTVQTVYLDEQELESLRKLELPANQAEVRDGILIQSYTGLRHSDLSRLEPKHINWKTNTINITTKKTGTLVVLPIHPIIKEILERYDNQLPHIQSNQSYNRMVKRLCQMAGIDEPITVVEIRGGKSVEVTRPKYEMISSHSFRRSFCSNAYKAGIPTIAIMKMSSHTSEANFLRYIRVSQSETAEMLQSHKFFNNDKS